MQQQPRDEGHAGEVYVVKRQRLAGKETADWDNAEVVRVEMSEFAHPSNLTFEAGKPYILQLVNVGAVEHEFVAEGFFSSVAWRKRTETGQSEVKAPFFTEVEVFPPARPTCISSRSCRPTAKVSNSCARSKGISKQECSDLYQCDRNGLLRHRYPSWLPLSTDPGRPTARTW